MQIANLHGKTHCREGFAGFSVNRIFIPWYVRIRIIEEGWPMFHRQRGDQACLRHRARSLRSLNMSGGTVIGCMEPDLGKELAISMRARTAAPQVEDLKQDFSLEGEIDESKWILSPSASMPWPWPLPQPVDEGWPLKKMWTGAPRLAWPGARTLS